MTFFTPTKIEISPDLRNLFRLTAAKNFLILSSKSAAEKSGGLSDVIDALGYEDKLFRYENSITPNPTVQSIDFLYEKYCNENIDAVISIGGGSVIDAGKALNLCLANKLDCSTLIKSDYSRFSKNLHIAIPTTCGTGSETSKGAILSDYENEWKGGVRGENVFCDIAILNPEYISSLPLQTCLATGFDAVSHAIETYVSRAATSITKSLSFASLKLLIPSLLSLSEKKEARSISSIERRDLLVGSCIAGINLANSSTCLPHRLQYCIGSITNTAHVDGVALLYPAWLKNLARHECQALLEINEFLRGYDNLNSSNPIIEFQRRMNVVKTPEQLGLSYEMKDKLVSLASGTLELDPGYNGLETVNFIFEETLSCKQ